MYPSDCTLDDLNLPSRLIFVRYPGGGLQCFRLSSYIECLNNSKNVDPITNITLNAHDIEAAMRQIEGTARQMGIRVEG